MRGRARAKIMSLQSSIGRISFIPNLAARPAFVILTLLWIYPRCISQDRAILKGIIVDAQTMQPIPLASILLKGTSLGAASDTTGAFEIHNIPPDLYAVEISHVAYKKAFRVVRLAADQIRDLTIKLQQEILPSEDVTVTAEYERAKKQRQPYASTVYTADQIKKIGVTKFSDLLSTLDASGPTGRVRRPTERTPYIIYLDGAYVQYIPGSLDVIVEVHQIERIEIARWVGVSPSAGPGSSDKVIYIFTKKPR